MVELLPANVQYFVEVARTGSVTEAAVALHIAPSAISRQIAKLEAALGAPLFVRHARGMALTEAGEGLLAYARRAEIEAAALLDSIGPSVSPAWRPIVVAATEGFAYRLVPRAMAELRRSHPDASFQLHVVPSEEATRLAAEGAVDVAATYSLEHRDGVRVEHISTWPLFAVVSADHPLAGRETVTLPELAPLPLAMGMRDTSQRRLLDSAARGEGVALNTVLECSRVAPIYEFARSGEGVGFVSELGAQPRSHDGVVHIRVDHPVFEERSAQLLTPLGRPQSPLVLDFLRLLMVQLDPEYVPERASLLRQRLPQG